MITIEAAEESNTYLSINIYTYRVDLLYYLNTYKHLLGNPNLVICLDSSAYSKETISITSSLRGSISNIFLF